MSSSNYSGQNLSLCSVLLFVMCIEPRLHPPFSSRLTPLPRWPPVTSGSLLAELKHFFYSFFLTVQTHQTTQSKAKSCLLSLNHQGRGGESEDERVILQMKVRGSNLIIRGYNEGRGGGGDRGPMLMVMSPVKTKAKTK